MRHNYSTRAIVLARRSAREAGSSVTLLTRELGLIEARAEGLRRPGAKLAHALQTLSESDIVLVRGKDGWRLSGALLVEDWFGKLERASRLRAGRVASLVLRLVGGEAKDTAFFDTFSSFVAALATLPEDAQDAAECFAALRILNALGLDAGALPSEMSIPQFTPEERKEIVARINRGLQASGL